MKDFRCDVIWHLSSYKLSSNTINIFLAVLSVTLMIWRVWLSCEGGKRDRGGDREKVGLAINVNVYVDMQ